MCMWRCVTAHGRWISLHKQTHKIEMFIEVISQTKILSIYDVRIKIIKIFSMVNHVIIMFEPFFH